MSLYLQNVVKNAYLVEGARRLPVWYEARTVRANADELADELLRHFHIDFPPTPIHNLAVALGIIVEYEAKRCPPWLYRLVTRGPSPDGPAVAELEISQYQPVPEQRQALAHAIGHLMLSPLGAEHVVHRFDQQSEHNATIFAGMLLLPEWILFPSLANIPRGQPGEETIAHWFNVPVSFAARRILRMLS